MGTEKGWVAEQLAKEGPAERVSRKQPSLSIVFQGTTSILLLCPAQCPPPVQQASAEWVEAQQE